MEPLNINMKLYYVSLPHFKVFYEALIMLIFGAIQGALK